MACRTRSTQTGACPCSGMQCHYCDDDAALAVEKDGIKVGLCEDHFRDRLQELQDSGFLEDVRDDLDIDR